MRVSHAALATLVLTSCADPAADVTDGAVGTDGTAAAPSDVPEPTDVVATDAAPADSDVVPEATDAPDPMTDPVRFVVLGDAGEGNADQHAVGQAIGTICDVRGCEFALYLGDNFYDDGVDSVDDPQFWSKFEAPYAHLDFPFWVVLGNHDYGEVPLQFWKSDHQVAYAQRSTIWTMPDKYYDFEMGPVHFLALDTNALMLNLDLRDRQTRWFRDTLDNSTSDWKIAFGHHPFKSNGRHGNAGNYEGAWYDVSGIVRGAEMATFFKEEACGKVDILFTGHDHNRQWIEAPCGVTQIVSGAGAKTTDFENRDNNQTIWQDDGIEGFVWVEIDGNTATFAFYDKDAKLQHEGTRTK